tara:strand:+ start:603 stop:1184 length:582 start_codon:yes stop_codon:yes gene_type:complete
VIGALVGYYTEALTEMLNANKQAQQVIGKLVEQQKKLEAEAKNLKEEDRKAEILVGIVEAARYWRKQPTDDVLEVLLRAIDEYEKRYGDDRVPSAARPARTGALSAADVGGGNAQLAAHQDGVPMGGPDNGQAMRGNVADALLDRPGQEPHHAVRNGASAPGPVESAQGTQPKRMTADEKWAKSGIPGTPEKD